MFCPEATFVYDCMIFGVNFEPQKCIGINTFWHDMLNLVVCIFGEIFSTMNALA